MCPERRDCLFPRALCGCISSDRRVSRSRLISLSRGSHACRPSPHVRTPRSAPPAIRTRHFSRRTEQAYVRWAYRYFHGTRHPADLGAREVGAFLSHLAVKGEVAASTQNQALAALLFLYREVLDRDVGELDGLAHAKKPARLRSCYGHDHHAPGSASGSAAGASSRRSGVSPAGSRFGSRRCVPAVCIGAQISPRAARMGMAMGHSVRSSFRRPALWYCTASPPVGITSAAGDAGGDPLQTTR